MSRTTLIRGLCASLLLTLAIASDSSAGQRRVAANSAELGAAWQRGAAQDAGRSGAAVAVDVRFDVLKDAAERGGVVSLPLPDREVRFRVEWAESSDTQSFIAGRLIDGEGDASLTIVGDALSGRIVVDGRIFLVRRTAGATTHLVTERDQASLPPEAPARSPRNAARQQAPEADAARPQPAGDSNAFVDLMILYTPAARSAIGGTSPMVAELAGAVNNANLALANANVTHRYRLVHQQEVAYSEPGDMELTLEHLTFTGDGQLENVPALRDQYRADVVTLLSNDFDFCGLGWFMEAGDVNSSFQQWAFNVVAWDCANANLSMAHEIGHNMGLEHDRPNAGTTPPSFPYAYGYAVNGVARDVMAYDSTCSSGCPRRAIYSTPLFNFPGTAVRAGTATEDGARALNNTSSVVANFRQSVCTTTVSPTAASFPATGGAGTVSVTAGGAFCSWTAASSNPAVVTITGGSSGAGNGVVSYVVSPHSGAASRTATLTINDRTVTIFQAGRNNTGDVDGDGKSDITVFRPSAGSWYILRSSTGFTGGLGYAWGASTDLPLVGDFDGDGRNDLVAYRASSGHWFILTSSSNFTTYLIYQWGTAGDKAVPADYDGDGRTDIAIYRPSSGTWYVLTSGSGYASAFAYAWGVNSDIPVPGDYDGDLRADLAVFRPSSGHWFILRSGTSYTTSLTYQWGTTGDTAVPADYDGDNRADIAIYRPSTGGWYMLTSSSNFTSGAGYVWGASTDTPVPADYDGDGRTDVAVYRSSSAHWFILKSTTNFTSSITYQWGTTGDIPVLRRP